MTNTIDLSSYTEDMLWELYLAGAISKSELFLELRQRDETLN